MYLVNISRIAEKQMETLPKEMANAVRQKIDLLSEDPHPAGCKKLQGIENAYRIRQGDSGLFIALKIKS